MAAKKATPVVAELTPAEKEKGMKLVADVIASPNDDAPRLVYADWLIERNDPRGEFIQIQCQLPRPVWGTRKIPAPPKGAELSKEAALTQREQALMTKHAKDWLAPIRPFLRTWSWLRGFLDQIHVNASFFAGAADVLTTHPIRLVCFEGLKPGDIEQFAKTPFPNLRQLDLTGMPLTAKNAEALASETLGSVEVLRVTNTRICGAWSAIVKAGHLRALKSLSARSSGLDDEGIEALASSPTFANLEDAILSANKISSAGAMALAESTHLAKLKTLTLDPYVTNEIGATALKALEARYEVRMES